MFLEFFSWLNQIQIPLEQEIRTVIFLSIFLIKGSNCFSYLLKTLTHLIKANLAALHQRCSVTRRLLLNSILANSSLRFNFGAASDVVSVVATVFPTCLGFLFHFMQSLFPCSLYGCIHLPDVGQKLEILEYINSGLIVKEDPRTEDRIIIDEEWKLKVSVCIRVTMMAYVEVVESSFSFENGDRSHVFLRITYTSSMF